MRVTNPDGALSVTVLRLAGTYLAIIMLMSIGFSLIFYVTSSQQLSHQVPSADHSNFIGRLLISPEASQYLQQQVHDSRIVLQQRLIFINIMALCLGSVLSYWLARRTLRPIAEAMETQSQFVSDASHELRTPLTALQTSNDVALRKPNLTLREAKELIKQDTEDIKRLRDLSDGLLNLARQAQTVAKKPVDLGDVTGEAMTQIAHKAIQKDILFKDEMEPLSVLGDQRSLVQLLVILLDNAVKYSHKKGTIYVMAHKKGKQAVLAVRDEGIGIAADDVPHVFQRFYRADNARTHSDQGSFGLGLSIAEHIVLNHHGTIRVASEPGEGSTFRVTLPLA